MHPLPIDAAIPGILNTLAQHRCVVLQAPPGAGKTTRLPPALLDWPPLSERHEVVVLEPRRIAARLAAQRIASERNERLGDRIGYQVRFENATSASTRLRFVTEAILTRQFATDPTLRRTGVVILDEFHERHLHSDVALALTRRLQLTDRSDLRLVVMSATLQAADVARFLGNCPIIELQGARFDVDIQYEPQPDRPLAQQVALAVRRLVREGLDGDVLVFLPGVAEIRKAWQACEPVARDANLALLMLHGELPASEQARALEPLPQRKVILSTNVAESSITIDGVVAVIDSGFARMASHAPWSGLPTLAVRPVSRASAIQRAGRAGRTRPGRCVRLYAKHDFETRPEHDAPEIARVDLAETALTLRAATTAGFDELPWLDAPPQPAKVAAERLLEQLGAVREGKLTTIGRQMLAYPAHPRVARMLVEAERRGLSERVCILAAIMSERSLTTGRAMVGTRQAAHGSTDLMALANLFEEAQLADFDASVIEALGLDRAAVAAVERARKHLHRLTRDNAKASGDWQRHEALCVLSGYPDRVGKTLRHADVTLSEGGLATLASPLDFEGQQFLVVVDAQDRAEGKTRKTVVRLACGIDAEALLELFPDEVRTQCEVRWNEEKQRVEAREKLMYRALVLDEGAAGAAAREQASQMLFEQAKRRDLDDVTGSDELRKLLARAAFVTQYAPQAGLDRLNEEAAWTVIRELCESRSSLDELRKAGIANLMLSRLTPGQRQALDQLAPERIQLPNRRALPVHYEAQTQPWVSSRLQDFFGMAKSPTVAAGRVPVVIHLLAPSGRPVQVTADLAGFWERAYPELRRQLMRRYPKHAWPEDGRTATAPPPGRLRG